MNEATRNDWLNGRGARVVAVLVAVSAGAVLAYLHRDDLFPSERKPSPAEAAFEQCMAERAAGIDEMVRQQVITAEQEALFRQRAEALCRAQSAPADAAPPPVGLTPALPQQ
ncbi:MAG: hypothetical protein L0210_03825 [Rhodospirillales bacterium]|nr:hypothetical protein [Rhodospirillales bacterium]